MTAATVKVGSHVVHRHASEPRPVGRVLRFTERARTAGDARMARVEWANGETRRVPVAHLIVVEPPS